jgi:hypothetical protein
MGNNVVSKIGRVVSFQRMTTETAPRGPRAAVRRPWLCTLLIAGGSLFVLASDAAAQLATAGAGVLISERPQQPVFELHGETPPFPADARGYVTLSWTDQSWAPTIISAAELPVLRFDGAFTGVGAGLLWLEVNEYRPYPMLVSTTVVPLPVPRTSFVLIASTLPFENFDWSLVLKVGVTLFFIR